MDWVQVADDAVKIGLGAMIGAVGSYIVGRITSRAALQTAAVAAQAQLDVARAHRETELERERLTRQDVLIGDIAIKLESFHNDFRRYLQLIDVAGDLGALEDDLTRDRVKENRQRRADLGSDGVAEARRIAKESNDALVHPRIYVRLLGSDALHGSFQAYERAAEVLWLESGRSGVGILDAAQYEKLIGAYRAARATLLGDLADIFPLKLPAT